MSDDKIEELDGSELGTKDYWDQSYHTEIKNYQSHGDVGEVWFDEDSQIRVINWMLKNDVSADSEIIDLGNILHIYVNCMTYPIKWTLIDIRSLLCFHVSSNEI